MRWISRIDLLRLVLLLALTGGVFAYRMAGSASAAVGSAIVVNTLVDDATAGDRFCTLREAINNANANTDTTSGDCVAGSSDDTVTFAVTGTITLASATPAISDAAGLTVDGPGRDMLTISGGDAVQVVNVPSGATLVLEGVTVANGAEHEGGGIHNEGVVRVSDSGIAANRALDGGALGGGIYNSGALTVLNSMISNNFAGFPSGAAGGGGGIYNRGTLTVSHASFSDNFAGGVAGGMINVGNTVVSDSTFSGNSGHNGSTGAISNGGTLTVSTSTFTANAALIGSGGAINNFGSLTVSDSTFSSNTANLDSAAISLSP